MAQVPMRMPPGAGSSAPQHIMQPSGGGAGAAAHHVLHHTSQPGQHLLHTNGASAAQHVIQQTNPASHHVVHQTSAAAQHNNPQPQQQHPVQQQQQQQQQQQHVIQQRGIPTPHQPLQGVGGHTPGNLPSSNHVIISQYGHPPTSLPGVIVSVSSSHPAPPPPPPAPPSHPSHQQQQTQPPQHILLGNGTTIPHMTQVDASGAAGGGPVPTGAGAAGPAGAYHRQPPQHPTVPTSYARPPPVLVSNNTTLEMENSVKAKEKTPMCLVNELARFNKIQHQYKLTDESGPAHKKNFTVCLKIGDKEEYEASGPSIKKAQHAAAAIALEKTQLKHPTPKPSTAKSTNVTPTVELNAMAMKRGEAASYTFIQPNRSNHFSVNPRSRSGSFPPMFVIQLKVGNNEYIGEGATAQAARHCAASQALKMMKESANCEGKSKLDPTSNPFIPGTEYDELKSPISLVHEIALKRNLPVSFVVVRETGPPHMRMFITRCAVGDLICEGEGNGKKVSKKRAAEGMLKKLRQLPPVASVAVALAPKQRKSTNTKKKSKNLIKDESKETNDPKQSINPISRLIQIQQAKKEKEPTYSLIGERGMPRRREFFIKVTVGENSAVGSGPNKKVAKKAAAEALLQMTGYSRPTALPTKPALKSPGEVSDKTKKLTFVDKVAVSEASSGTSGSGAISGTSGSSGRQLVPGLLYIDDKTAKISSKACNGGTAYEKKSPTQCQAATIAKELLDGGTSATADQLAKQAGPGGASVPGPLAHLPTTGQGVSSKEQLAYLSQIVGFTVTYSDFPKKGEYLTLVSLSTNPPQVSHGSGQSLEASHNNAAHTALKNLASTGLDTIEQDTSTTGRL